MLRLFPLLALLLLWPSLSPAAPTPDRLSPATRHALGRLRAGLPLLEPGRLTSTPVSRVSLVVQLAPGAGRDSVRRQLEALGGLVVGRSLEHSRGPIWTVQVPTSALASVAKMEALRRIEVTPAGPQPELTDDAADMTQVAATWASLGPSGMPVTGKGVRIGAIDSWIDLFHPAFFRADGGHFAWVDANSNGVFDPAIDGVDRDGDGVIGGGERLTLIKGGVFWHEEDDYYEQVTYNDGGPLVADLDWLWQDSNENGERDVGTSENAPCMGEPLYVVDDINGNNKLDLHEHVVALRTSKIEAIVFPGNGEVFRRGENLHEYPRLLGESSHATMTVGVLAGGQPGYHRIHGVAPDADILLADMNQGVYLGPDPPYGNSYLAGLLWLADQGAQVVMHEYGSPLMEFGDGSSLMEQGIDQVAAEQGVLSCTATHNYAGYEMHGVAPAPAGGTADFEFETGLYGGYYPTLYVYLTLRWREPQSALSFEVVMPDGTSLQFSGPGEADLEAGEVQLWYSGQSESDRGTAMANFVAYGGGYASSLPEGTWHLKVLNNGTADQQLDLFAADQTGYFYTGSLVNHATKSGTISHPATADSALSVGAYRANIDSWYGEVEKGDLTYYSGRGPRIDGLRGTDVVGPSDALAAWYDPDAPFYPAFSYASGTSGSLPQATGVAALVLQEYPALDATELRARIEESALLDQYTGPEASPTWGAGKLNAYGALFQSEPVVELPPVAIISGPTEVRLGESFTLSAANSTDTETPELLLFRWDLGYNGGYELDWREEPELSIDGLYAPGWFVVVMEVRDGAGRTDRALHAVHVLDEQWEPPVEPSPADIVAPSPDTTEPEVTPEDGAGHDIESHAGGSSDCHAGNTPGDLWGLLLLVLMMGLLVGLRANQTKRETKR